MENEGAKIEKAVTNECDKKERCAEVKIINENMAEQKPVWPQAVCGEDLIVKIPVVLAETSITIPIEAIITLDKPAMEIKRIKKNVYLTQARLIPEFDKKGQKDGILFVSGYIRKNIEYATETCGSMKNSNICGDIRHCTVDVPFNFTTKVEFMNTPIFKSNEATRELAYFTDEIKSCDHCADPIYGSNPCDQGFIVTETFNEKPYVELVEAKMVAVDIHKDSEKDMKDPTRQYFNKLVEKIVVTLTIKVLQKQQVKLGK